MKWLICLFSLSFSLIFAAEQTTRVEKCLVECYHVDAAASAKILEILSPLMENHPSVIDTFIEESEKLNVYADPNGCDSSPSLQPYHPVVFENSHIRISYAVTKSGEQEPSQIHPWKTVMVIIQPSPFHTEQGSGAVYEDNWPIGVYVLEPSLEQFSCKNIGPHDYRGLIIEIKPNCHS